MKKYTLKILWIIFVVFVFSDCFAFQSRSIDFKLGVFNPEKVESGLLLGARFGSQIDNRMNIGLSFDYYHKSDYETEGGKQINAKFSTNMLPIMLDIEAKFPMQYRSAIIPIVHLSFGYEMVWNKADYKEPQDGDDEGTKIYHGFGWMLGSGILYKIGYNSDLIFEIFYNNSKPKRDAGQWVLPEEFNVSGIGARIGVRIKSF